MKLIFNSLIFFNFLPFSSPVFYVVVVCVHNGRIVHIWMHVEAVVWTRLCDRNNNNGGTEIRMFRG